MRRRTKILITLGLLTALPVMILTVGMLYLKFADLSGYRSTVERLVSDALGRELCIDGAFELHVSFTTSLEAREITLANVEWGSEPTMLTVDHLSASIDLMSLIRGPVHIHHLEIEGARVLVESSADIPVNWLFEALEKEWHRPITTREYVVDRAELKNVKAILRLPALEHPLELMIALLGFSSNQSDSIDIRLDGSLNEMALGLEGQLGPLSGLLTAGSIAFDFEGRLSEADFTTAGQIARLADLDGATIDLDLHGPDLAALTEPFDLPSLGEEPFRLDAHLEPSPAGSALALDADLGDLKARVDGSLDSLLSPKLLDITVAASGPDLAAAGTLTGIDRLPADPFEVSGGLTWQGFPLTCDGITLRVGENNLSVDGVLGQPPRMLETDFTIRGEGPDASSLAVLFGLELPADPFEVQGRLLRMESGLQVESVEARIGRATLEADGFVGDPPEYDGTDLQASVQGPDLSRYSNLTGVDLPVKSFEISGHIGEDGESIVLQEGSARLGDNSASIMGKIRVVDEHTELDLQLDVEGPDLSRIPWLAGIDGLPAEPYRAAGAVGIHPDGWHLSEVRVDSGGMSLEAEGIVVPGPGILGTELRLRFAGSDSSYPASLAGLEGVPPGAFTVEGAIRIVDDGYALEAVEAEVGSVLARIEGLLGSPPALLGTVLRVTGRGENLSVFEPFLGGTLLPDEPFEVAGSLAVDEAGCRLDSVELKTAANRASVSGLLAVRKKLEGSNVAFEVEGRNLRELGESLSAAGVDGIPELPAEAITVTGRVEIDEAGFLLHGVKGRLGSGTLQLDGRVGPPPEFRGTDLMVLGNGPDATLFTALTGGEIELAPFQLSGRVERPGTDFRFHDFNVRLGEYLAVLSGILGEPPTLAGTDLSFEMAGPGLGLPRQIADLFDLRFQYDLPDKPFAVTGYASGSPEDFTITRLDAQLGDSDFTGWFRLDLEEKPRLHGELTSESINLAPLLKQHGCVDESADTNEVEPTRDRGNLLISDDPIDLALLNRIDADVSLSVQEILLPRSRLEDVQVGIRMENGALRVDPVSATGSRGGVLGGHFSVEPAEEGGYRVLADLTMDGGHLDMSNLTEDSRNWVVLDIDVDFHGSGRSLHEIAGNADGFFEVAVSEGIVDHTLFELVSSGILHQILDLFNPVRQQEPATELHCAVVVMNLNKGLATIDPLVMQTEKMSMSGQGEIDLTTEEFELRWLTKPRKGFGFSAGMLTDNFVRLGGTLTEPQLEMMPLRAAVSTGLTVGTVGLALLGKGLWNRFTAHRKVCGRALEEATQKRDEQGSHR